MHERLPIDAERGADLIEVRTIVASVCDIDLAFAAAHGHGRRRGLERDACHDGQQRIELPGRWTEAATWVGDERHAIR